MSFHRLCLISILFYQSISCFDYDSAEFNRVEFTPSYDTIIFSDIADILNEFNNNMNIPINMSDSESDENIEDLLSEYHHYLERAQKQRLGYKEKLNPKNKIPLLRHEKFVKAKPGFNMPNDFHKTSNLFSPNIKFPHSSISSPIDFLIPISSKILSPSLPSSEHTNIPLACYCQEGQIPCKCACRQCFYPTTTMRQNYLQDMKIVSSDQGRIPISNTVPYLGLHNKLRDLPQNNNMLDDSFNIRIKVDIQLPKFLENFQKFARNQSVVSEPLDVSPSLNMPLPYMNFPVPMELFGLKRSSEMNNHESAPFHRFTLHKKKKSRTNTKKQHRKKVMSMHNMQIEPQKQLYQNIEEYYNPFESSSVPNIINETPVKNKVLAMNNNETTTEISTNKLNVNVTGSSIAINELETTTASFNTSNKIGNVTEEHPKSENSIEIDNAKIMITTPTAIRQKREIIQNKSLPTNQNLKVEHDANKTDLSKTMTQQQTSINTKIVEKDTLSDSELLLWPSTIINKTLANTKNITTLILEKEDKKVKLNMSKDSIRLNHTSALEHAIFGEVTWEDVDTVAPAFMSFVGKYIRGVLTFCSEKICHSMKCADKKCIHRTCAPEQRLNNKGHCGGSDNSDSFTFADSIMDLPSNISFEVVDILESKLQGKLYGKATLCINTKCSTFAVSKKKFAKAKCSTKELNSSGHCNNLKNIKIM